MSVSRRSASSPRPLDPIGLAGSIYFIGALVAGGGLTVFGALQAREPSTTSARRVLFASLFYLPAVLALLALDKR